MERELFLVSLGSIYSVAYTILGIAKHLTFLCESIQAYFVEGGEVSAIPNRTVATQVPLADTPYDVIRIKPPLDYRSYGLG